MLIGLRSAALAFCKFTAKSYVQDGLVAHWDGIENAGYGQHDASLTQWNDLVSGKVMGRRTFDERNYALVSANSYATQFSLSSDLTLHSCLINPPINAYFRNLLAIGIASGFEKGIHLSCGHRESYCVDYRKGYSTTPIVSIPTGTVEGQTYSVDIVFVYATKTISVYVDSVLVGSSSVPESDWVSDGDSCYLGLSAYELDTNMGNYDILLYNRALSASEISANYKVDKKRFGIS